MLAGIAAAQAAGFEKIRLNAVAIRGLTEDEIVPLARFARERGLELRFIEFMPLDAEQHWQIDRRARRRRDPPHRSKPSSARSCPSRRPHPSQPATDFDFADGGGRIGFINPVSQPFCGDCNRLRLTAEGQVRNCLFSTAEWDARALLRGGGSDDELADLVRDCVWRQGAGPRHRQRRLRPARAGHVPDRRVNGQSATSVANRRTVGDVGHSTIASSTRYQGL